jgi:hypothetical protein
LWIVGIDMFNIACTFLRFGIFPSLETMNLKISPKNTLKVHFSRLRLILYFLHF